ncbi:MAG: iron-sulfur cluster assembly accessory protein [Deltaproteobacteria bacterium]|nr:iron-sulfur cluster assembly accessory protein [Deltaproteobacteria bacterium]
MSEHTVTHQNDDVSVAGEPVRLSSTAVARVKVLLQREKRSDPAGLRVSVLGGGCSGLQYSLELDDAPREGDAVYVYEGVRVFVDSTSAPYLSGMSVDYVDGLHGAGFKFTNPNADRTCGCGSSFSV